MGKSSTLNVGAGAFVLGLFAIALGALALVRGRRTNSVAGPMKA